MAQRPNLSPLVTAPLAQVFACAHCVGILCGMSALQITRAGQKAEREREEKPCPYHCLFPLEDNNAYLCPLEPDGHMQPTTIY